MTLRFAVQTFQNLNDIALYPVIGGYSNIVLSLAHEERVSTTIVLSLVCRGDASPSPI